MNVFYYVLLFLLYISMIASSLSKGDLLVEVLLVTSLVIMTFIFKRKKKNNYTDILIFVCCMLSAYSISLEYKIQFIILMILCATVMLSIFFITKINKIIDKLNIILLIIITLNSSFLELYVSDNVSGYKIILLLFMLVLNCYRVKGNLFKIKSKKKPKRNSINLEE